MINLGTFLSAVAPTVNVALSLSGPLLVPLMIFSGYLLNVEYVLRAILIFNRLYQLKSYSFSEIYQSTFCLWNSCHGKFMNKYTVNRDLIYSSISYRFGYANENLLINQFYGVENMECDEPGDTKCLKHFSNGDDVLEFFKVDPDSFYLNVFCLFFIILGWRILAFIVLLIRTTNKHKWILFV